MPSAVPAVVAGICTHQRSSCGKTAARLVLAGASGCCQSNECWHRRAGEAMRITRLTPRWKCLLCHPRCHRCRTTAIKSSNLGLNCIYQAAFVGVQIAHSSKCVVNAGWRSVQRRRGLRQIGGTGNPACKVDLPDGQCLGLICSLACDELPAASLYFAECLPSFRGDVVDIHDNPGLTGPVHVQGNIASWKKKEGDEIAAGDVLCEVETDKVQLPARFACHPSCTSGHGIHIQLHVQDLCAAAINARALRMDAQNMILARSPLTRLFSQHNRV